MILRGSAASTGRMHPVEVHCSLVIASMANRRRSNRREGSLWSSPAKEKGTWLFSICLGFWGLSEAIDFSPCMDEFSRA